MKLKILLILVLILVAFSAHAYQIKLAWNTSNGVAGYKIYWGTSSRSYTNALDVKNVQTVTIPGFVDGTIYYFAATAYDSSNFESDYSKEINWESLDVSGNNRLIK